MLRFDFENGDGQAPRVYTIEFARKATDEIDIAFAWYRERSAQFAEKWYRDLVVAIYALIAQPTSHPVFREIKR